MPPLEPVDVIYLLNSLERRLVIEILAQRVESGDRQTHYRQLANLVLARERDRTRIRGHTPRSRDSGLRQNQLPLLDTHGLIDWDETSGTIHATDSIVEVHAALNAVRERCPAGDSQTRREGIDGEH